ncbi:MAG: alpha/beta fold hydrolase, partial [Candidatus Nitrotoga sp.]
ALQVRGSEHERELLADLRARLFSRGEPNIAALRGGLEILRNTDLRAVLSQITQAALVIAGERDLLASPAASGYLAQQLPNAQLLNIQGASHAPFLSHPDIFVQRIEAFLNG